MKSAATKPLRVARYRDATTGAHAFVTKPDTQPSLPASFAEEDVPDSVALSPVFYVHTAQYKYTVPLYRFRKPDGSLRFAASPEERLAFRSQGLAEVAPPVYIYDRPVEGVSEVFRIAKPDASDIVYTTSPAEKDYYLKHGWTQMASLGFAQSTSSSGAGILRDSTVKLDAADQRLVSDVAKQGQTIVFASTNSKIAALFAGTVLYAEKSSVFPHGIVAKVDSMTPTKSGGLEVHTTPAELSDAFEEFHIYLDNRRIYFPQTLHSPPANMALRDGKVLPVYLSAPEAVTSDDDVYAGYTWNPYWSFSGDLCDDCSFNINLSGYLSLAATAELVWNSCLDITGITCQPELNFLLTGQENSSLSLTATGEISGDGEICLVPTITATWPTPIGIPVSVDLNLFGGFSGDATATANISVSESANATLGADVVLTDAVLGQFTATQVACPTTCPDGFSCGDPPVSGPTCALTFQGPTGSWSASADLDVYVEPQVYAYVGAFSVGLGPTASAKLQLEAVYEPPDVNVYAELIPGVSFQYTLPGADEPDVLWNYESPGLSDLIASFPLESVTAPATPTGQTNGVSGTAYTYCTTGAADSLGNPVQYQFNWGDGSSTGWLAVGSVCASHAWLAGGNYPVTAIAESAGNSSVVSPSSGTLTVSINNTTNGPAPVITSLSPNNATAGGPAFTLTVNGSNFVTNSTVNWNGTALPTTFIGSAQLQAAVPAADIASIGQTYTAPVTVSNPPAAGGPSAPATFTINAPNSPLPVLQVSPSSLSFGGTQGGNPPVSGFFTVTNTGSGPLNWTASHSSSWLSLSATSGTAPANVTVSIVNFDGLGTGTYNDTITVSSSNAQNSPAKISVTLTVQGVVVLTLNSVNPLSGVAMTVSPSDINGRSNGTTPFTRYYTSGTTVLLGASQTAGGYNIAIWDVNNVQENQSSNNLTFSHLSESTTVTLYYGLLVDVQAQSNTTGGITGVPIQVTPPDVGNQGNGQTEFYRVYDSGAKVTLTAPATSNGDQFSYWWGCSLFAGETCLINNPGGEVTAYYAAPASTMTFLSFSPNGVGANVEFSAGVICEQYGIGPGEVKYCNADAPYCEDLGLLGTSQSNSGGGALNLQLGPGTHNVKAVFVGNPIDETSTSAMQTVTVSGPVATSTAISASGPQGSYVLTAVVSGGGSIAPTGTLSFQDSSNGNASVASVTLNPATAAITFPGSPFATGSLPGSVASGDFNNDGYLDLAIANQQDNTISVLLGKGDGTFQPQQTYATGTYPSSIGAGDFNNDGNTDLVVTNTRDNTVSLLLGNGNGTFQPQQTFATGTYPSSLAIGDFNGDGVLDLAVTNAGDNTVTVLLGGGNMSQGGVFFAQGVFLNFQTYPVGNLPSSVAVGDFNGDGKPDLAIANNRDSTVSILLGNGDGTFQSQQTYSTGRGPSSLKVADFNVDGKLDLVTANQGDDTVSVLLGNGNGTFQGQQTYSANSNPISVAVGDFNADGKLDLAVANALGNTVTVLPGNGSGSFGSPQAFATGNNPVAVATGDFNGDGEMDLGLVNQNDNTVSLMLQQWSVSGVSSALSLPPQGSTHALVAYYGGDSNYGSSTSPAIDLTGSALATTLTLTASPTSINVGQNVTLKAVLQPYASGSATTNGETVTFGAGATTLGTGTLSNGTATLTTNALPAGANTLTAWYTPSPSDLTFQASTSAPLPFTVNNPNPAVLSIAKSHSGSFTQGQTGAVYSVTVSNSSAAGPTSGAVYVTENVPVGLSLISLAGNGWNCAGFVCSRSDALSAGSQYSPIAVTVNVAGNAPASVVNQVTVSGGGSANASASDPTNVSPPSGTVTVNATLNGSAWSGPVNYTLTGLTGQSGASVPTTYSTESAGSYSLTYNSGGPSGATLASITPSGTQTLNGGGTITFTLNFTAPTTGTINVSATLNGSAWTGSVSYTLSGPTGQTGSSVPTSNSSEAAGNYSLTYKSGGPSGATLASITPSSNQTLSGGASITFTLNFTAPTTGTINVNATLNGSAWAGPVSYTLSGPTGQTGSTVPTTYSSEAAGSYSLTYNSGGPSGATLASITPSGTQTLNGGGTITFTLNFTAPTTGTINVNATLNGSAWSGSVSYTLSGPTSQTGSTVPSTYSSEAPGSYSITYTSGGPSDGTLISVAPSGGQTLIAGGAITFTLNFRTAASFDTISGQVLLSGAELSGVTMTLSGSQNASTASGVSGYGFTVPMGGTYTITPSLAGYCFAPPSATFADLSVNETANFTAFASSVSPMLVYLDSTSQPGPSLSVTTGAACSWSAYASSFITITSGANGIGNGAVSFSVSANTSGADRTGLLTVAGQMVLVTQRANAEIFTDVTPVDYYFDFADLMDTDDITAGCQASPPEYCPNSTTTRGEMAVFLITSIFQGQAFNYPTTPYFTDVAANNAFFPFIQELRSLGITDGCTATTFCPNDSVTRAEMAVFIIAARYGSTPYTYPSTPYFSDVPASNSFFKFIQKMAQMGITAGCGGGQYCLNETLTRAQMAVFIVTGLRDQLVPSGSAYIASASPNSVSGPGPVSVALTGVNTNFAQGATQVIAGSGITVSNINVISPTSLTVQLDVPYIAGPYPGPLPNTVIVITGTQEADLVNGFVIPILPQ